MGIAHHHFIEKEQDSGISNFQFISACKNSLIPCNRRDSLDTLDTQSSTKFYPCA
jgi:hypothetical protein